MSHQQQNPPPVSQQMGNSEAADVVKPFSIRQYVLACRQKSVSHSWPFPNKYLQMCLNHGLKDVLPPFESLKVKGCFSNLVNYSQNDHDSKELAEFCKTESVQQHVIEQNQQNIKNECDFNVSHGEVSYKKVTKEYEWPSTFTLNQSSIHVHKILPSKLMKDKRKRRKGRCKKRSMVDILAVARHSTL
ncbi:unnamed protein product [Trifolium pratense]|uniref:Uncharacterized protein n=1 Tax=Trifolium pratense TaxID=57577 RepID=A0ACB0IFL4_TRIPR|nr:unnamed protein product [Trifolium pratense]